MLQTLRLNNQCTTLNKREGWDVWWWRLVDYCQTIHFMSRFSKLLEKAVNARTCTSFMECVQAFSSPSMLWHYMVWALFYFKYTFWLKGLLFFIFCKCCQQKLYFTCCNWCSLTFLLEVSEKCGSSSKKQTKVLCDRWLFEFITEKYYSE